MKRTGQMVAIAAFGVLGGVAYGLSSLRPAQAEGPPELDALRERLQDFQTLWLRFEWPPPLERSSHLAAPAGAVRIERTTGRVTIDTGSFRISWDGQHLWSDARNDLPAQRLGDAADEKMAAFVGELLAGLPNTAFIAPGEDWGPGNTGWRIDLPFDWDDDYAVLLGGMDAGGSEPRTLRVLDKVTKHPPNLSGIALQLSLSVHWDARLLDDLDNKESLGSRTEKVSGDSWDEVWVGPSLFPGHHVESTRNGLRFDAQASAGWLAPSGLEVPQTRIVDVTCQNAGQVVSAPISLRFDVDPTAASAEFLPDALAAGCPLSLTMGVVHVHEPVLGSRTKVQGMVRLRDTSTTPPTLLAQRAFDETIVGPNGGRRRKEYEIKSLPTSFDPAALEMRIEGTVEVRCTAAGAGPSTVGFGLERETPPLLSWPGCYPELGVVP